MSLLILGAGIAEAQRGGCLDAEPSGSTLRIAGQDEPGERLVVSGAVLTADGKLGAGIRVRVYHTDASGYYSPGGMDESNVRLCGVLITGEDGTYRVETILPGKYATGGPAPHVHFDVSLPEGGTRLYTVFWREIREGGDPEAGERSASARPMTRDESGLLRLAYDIRLR